MARSAKQIAQTKKFTVCARQTKGMTAPKRKAAMKDCLKGEK